MTKWPLFTYLKGKNPSFNLQTLEISMGSLSQLQTNCLFSSWWLVLNSELNWIELCSKIKTVTTISNKKRVISNSFIRQYHRIIFNQLALFNLGLVMFGKPFFNVMCSQTNLSIQGWSFEILWQMSNLE